jgi:hypothetical protein
MNSNINVKCVPYKRATNIYCHCTKLIPSEFVHPCSTNDTKMILKMNRDYSLTINKLGIHRIVLNYSSKKKNPKVFPFRT